MTQRLKFRVSDAPKYVTPDRQVTDAIKSAIAEHDKAYEAALNVQIDYEEAEQAADHARAQWAAELKEAARAGKPFKKAVPAHDTDTARLVAQANVDAHLEGAGRAVTNLHQALVAGQQEGMRDALEREAHLADEVRARVQELRDAVVAHKTAGADVEWWHSLAMDPRTIPLGLGAGVPAFEVERGLTTAINELDTTMRDRRLAFDHEEVRATEENRAEAERIKGKPKR